MHRKTLKMLAAFAAAAVAAGCRRGVQTVTTNCAKKHLDEYRKAAK